MEKEISLLESVLNALNGIETKGKRNHMLVIACMNDVESVIKDLRKVSECNGDVHDKS